MSPARSKSQRRLMAAAEHGATFPMAKKVRASMTHGQMRAFAKTKETKLPTHVARGTAKKARKAPMHMGPANRYGQLMKSR